MRERLEAEQQGAGFLLTHTYRLWDLLVPQEGNTYNAELELA